MSWLIEVSVVLSLLVGVAALFTFSWDLRRQRTGRSTDHWIAMRTSIPTEAGFAAAAAATYDAPTIEGPLLIKDEWIPDTPIPISSIKYTLTPNTTRQLTLAPASGVIPVGQRREQYHSYSEAFGDLMKPKIFEDRPCYRATKVDLRSSPPVIALEMMTFFDFINTGEAMRHEWHQVGGQLKMARLRSSLGDLVDLSTRNVLVGLNVLTLRVSDGEGTYLLHRRDPASVAIGRQELSVVPCGVFQPSSESPSSLTLDADFWPGIVREYAEEMLGEAEANWLGSASIDYERKEPYSSFARARDAGTFRLHLIGAGIQPVTGALDFLFVGVFDADEYDALFSTVSRSNEEGQVVGHLETASGIQGFPFSEDGVASHLTSSTLSPASAACLSLAWHQRDSLLPAPGGGGRQ